MDDAKSLLQLVVAGQIARRAKEMQSAYKQKQYGAEKDGKPVPPEKTRLQFVEDAVAELRESHALIAELMDWTS